MIHLAQWSAIAPLALLLIMRRQVGDAYWLVALGFAVSLFADYGAVLLGGSWALTYVYPALQLGIFGWAFGTRWIERILLAIAWVQIELTSMTGPDILLTTLGSAMVLYVCIGHPLALTILAYCGLATCFYLLLATELFRPAFMPLWYGYQGARLLAFGLFIGIAHREASRA